MNPCTFQSMAEDFSPCCITTVCCEAQYRDSERDVLCTAPLCIMVEATAHCNLRCMLQTTPHLSCLDAHPALPSAWPPGEGTWSCGFWRWADQMKCITSERPAYTLSQSTPLQIPSSVTFCLGKSCGCCAPSLTWPTSPTQSYHLTVFPGVLLAG